MSEVKRISKKGDSNPRGQIERFDELVEKAYQQAEPLWAFTLALSRGLYCGEYSLDPEDAWWLGLLDFVLDSNLDRRLPVT